MEALKQKPGFWCFKWLFRITRDMPGYLQWQGSLTRCRSVLGLRGPQLPLGYSVPLGPKDLATQQASWRTSVYVIRHWDITSISASLLESIFIIKKGSIRLIFQVWVVKEGGKMAEEIIGLRGSLRGRKTITCVYIAGKSPWSGEKVKRREKRSDQ